MKESFSTSALTQSIGYSKSILCAIKGLNNYEEIKENKNKLGDLIASDRLKNNIEEKITLSQLYKNSVNDLRDCKSISCDLTKTASSDIISMSSAEDLSKSSFQKSQSLSQIDRLSLITFNKESKLNKICLRLENSCSLSSSIQSTENSAKIASNSSISSSLKNSDSFEESIPFSIYAEALYSCSTGDVTTFKTLLKKYPRLINYAYPNCYRLTPLHIAAKVGNSALVRYLVDQGANLNVRDDTWSTPLHLAAKANKPDVMNLLRALGANTKLMDGFGKTCSSYLMMSNFYENNISTFTNATSQSGNISLNSNSFSLSFHRMGSLRPLRRKVNKMKDLFGY